MPIVPQTEIQVNFLEEIFKETDEKRGEILAKFSVDFRPSTSREIGHKKFHINSSTHQDLKFHTAEPKFFHGETWELVGRALGPKNCLQFHFLEPKTYSHRFPAYWGDQQKHPVLQPCRGHPVKNRLTSVTNWLRAQSCGLVLAKNSCEKRIWGSRAGC